MRGYQLSKEYLVLCKEEPCLEPRGKRIFERARPFSDLERAAVFAESNQPAIIVRRLPALREELEIAVDKSRPFVVIAEHHGKYLAAWTRNPMRTYTVTRCGETELDNLTVRAGREKHFERAYRGIELLSPDIIYRNEK